MSSPGRGSFSALNAAERRSKLRQLAQVRGSVTLWTKGDIRRDAHRVRAFLREGDVLTLESDPSVPLHVVGQALLGSFELHGVSFFFKGQAGGTSADVLEVIVGGDFYKSERRRNFRMLAFPLYEVNLRLKLGEGYAGGNVLDIQRRPGNTGLFRSFLKLVEGAASETEASLRVQDLSATGLSLQLTEAELPWFKTGGSFEDAQLRFPDESISLPNLQVVYVVDLIGEKGPKRFKAGLRFGGDANTEDRVAAKINALLREVDANRDFEDFLK